MKSFEIYYKLNWFMQRTALEK